MPLDESIVADVANSNFKVVANAATVGLSQALSLAAQDAVSHQRVINSIRESALAEALGQRAGIDVTEAVSSKKVAEADLARTVDELGTAIAALQQIIKGAQTTPPPT
jgi:hypothetical protein